MIVNYYASLKTRVPFCGLHCCGNAFCHRYERSIYNSGHKKDNPKPAMRRYAKRAERPTIYRDIADELEYIEFIHAEYETMMDE